MTVFIEEDFRMDADKLICGIIRPIGDMVGYPAQHWADVHDIVTQALEASGFEARLVSEAASAGVIQGRIVKNLYENDLVVCDVSGKNANVMFELGMRLAFDRPTIIIKDDLTDYLFDPSPLEHLPYPRDLRFQKIVDFKKQLSASAIATVQNYGKEGSKGFIQHFGPIQVASFDHQDVPAQKLIIEELRELRGQVSRISSYRRSSGEERRPDYISLEFDISDMQHRDTHVALNKITSLSEVMGIEMKPGLHDTLFVFTPHASKGFIRQLQAAIQRILDETKGNVT